jgi:hypothetical protein
MLLRAILILGLCQFVCTTFAQTHRVPRNALFDYLIGHSREVQNISIPKEEVFLDLPLAEYSEAY